MNDFLDDFNRDKYSKSGRENVNRQSPSLDNSSGIPEDSSNEYFEKDPDSKKRRKKKVVLTIFIILVAILLIAVALYNLNTVKLPNFVGGYAEQAQAWALGNNIYLEIEEVYDLESNRGVVISQQPAAGETALKGGSVSILVSKGPDPEERIVLPDFTFMELYQIEQWIAENRVDNVSINRVYDDTIPENRFIKKEFRDPAVSEDSYRRKDRIIITVSRGPEEVEKDIEVPDFRGKPEVEVIQWAESNSINLTIESAYSDTIQTGQVISQDIAPKTRIGRNVYFTVQVSKGKAVRVPSFSGMSREEAAIRAAAANVNISSIDRYHDSIGIGQLIDQSVRTGTFMEENHDPVILYYSLGRPFIPDFSGQSENDVLQAIASMNDKLAFLSIKLEYMHDARTPKGHVIFNSDAGTRIPTGSMVTIKISKGGQAVIGNYVNKLIQSEEMQEEISELESKGLKIAYEYAASSRPEGTILSQSINPGSQINTADHVLVLRIAD